jgi:hypothetical protein
MSNTTEVTSNKETIAVIASFYGCEMRVMEAIKTKLKFLK